MVHQESRTKDRVVYIARLTLLDLAQFPDVRSPRILLYESDAMHWDLVRN
jgi:hypothetical protein